MGWVALMFVCPSVAPNNPDVGVVVVHTADNVAAAEVVDGYAGVAADAFEGNDAATMNLKHMATHSEALVYSADDV